MIMFSFWNITRGRVRDGLEKQLETGGPVRLGGVAEMPLGKEKACARAAVV